MAKLKDVLKETVEKFSGELSRAYIKLRIGINHEEFIFYSEKLFLEMTKEQSEREAGRYINVILSSDTDYGLYGSDLRIVFTESSGHPQCIESFPGQCGAAIIHNVKAEMLPISEYFLSRFNYTRAYLTVNRSTLMEELVKSFGYEVIDSFENKRTKKMVYTLKKEL